MRWYLKRREWGGGMGLRREERRGGRGSREGRRNEKMYDRIEDRPLHSGDARLVTTHVPVIALMIQCSSPLGVFRSEWSPGMFSGGGVKEVG